MSILKSISYTFAGLICLACTSNIWQTEVNAAESSSSHKPGIEKLDNASCQTCHDANKKEIKVAGAEGIMRPLHAIAGDKYAQSVHAKMLCVDCHKEITDNAAPHKKSLTPKGAACSATRICGKPPKRKIKLRKSRDWAWWYRI